MSYEISSQFIQFRKQIQSKIKNPSLNKYQQTATSLSKYDKSFNLQKQSLTNNLHSFKSKQTLCNIKQSPQRNLLASKKYKLRDSFNQVQNETLRSPKRLQQYITSKSQQSNLNQYQYFSKINRQQDYFDEQNEIKQYSSKYQKIMNEEQGLYYSKLQAKIDQLSNVIGNQVDRKCNVLEIDDLIGFSQKIDRKSKIEKYVDDLQFDSKVLQNDIYSIRSKLSRFSDSN